MDAIDGGGLDLLKMILALIFVLGLMGALTLALKKLGLSGHIGATGKKGRLKVIESIALDSKRRLAIIARDDVQHLVILGSNSETVVETDIPRVNNESYDS